MNLGSVIIPFNFFVLNEIIKYVVAERFSDDIAFFNRLYGFNQTARQGFYPELMFLFFGEMINIFFYRFREFIVFSMPSSPAASITEKAR